MKYTTLVLTWFALLSLTACDTQTSGQQQQIEARTMIIGGVPAHDKDYKLSPSTTLNEKLK